MTTTPDALSLARIWEHREDGYTTVEVARILARAVLRLAEERDAALARGIDAAINVVQRRQVHYELYRADGPMKTHPATFAIIDELLTFLGGLRSRNGAPDVSELQSLTTERDALRSALREACDLAYRPRHPDHTVTASDARNARIAALKAIAAGDA